MSLADLVETVGSGFVEQRRDFSYYCIMFVKEALYLSLQSGCKKVNYQFEHFYNSFGGQAGKKGGNQLCSEVELLPVMHGQLRNVSNVSCSQEAFFLEWLEVYEKYGILTNLSSQKLELLQCFTCDLRSGLEFLLLQKWSALLKIRNFCLVDTQFCSVVLFHFTLEVCQQKFEEFHSIFQIPNYLFYYFLFCKNQFPGLKTSSKTT